MIIVEGAGFKYNLNKMNANDKKNQVFNIINSLMRFLDAGVCNFLVVDTVAKLLKIMVLNSWSPHRHGI